MSRARPVTFPQRPLEEGKSLEAPQSVQDRFRGVSPRSDSKFRFRQALWVTWQLYVHCSLAHFDVGLDFFR